MAIILRDPVLKQKRMKFIEAVRKIPYLQAEIDLDEVKWGLIMGNTIESLFKVEMTMMEGSLEISAKFLCYGRDQVEDLKITSNSYFKDTVGARMSGSDFEAEEESVTFHYSVDLKSVDIDELILGTKMMEKKINQREHWSSL